METLSSIFTKRGQTSTSGTMMGGLQGCGQPRWDMKTLSSISRQQELSSHSGELGEDIMRIRGQLLLDFDFEKYFTKWEKIFVNKIKILINCSQYIIHV